MIKYFTSAAAKYLTDKRVENAKKYEEDTPFAEEFVSNLVNKGIVENAQYDVDFPTIRTFPRPGEEKWEMDFENSKALYDALVIKSQLPFGLLSDRRFVLYMTHVVYWKHMVSRWSIAACETEKKKDKRIGTRYCMLHEPLSRNEFLRLIWVPFATYDENKPEDPYHLTYIAKKYNNSIDRILDRAFSYDRRLLKAVLTAIENNPDYQRINNPNEYSRKFGVIINNLLGIKYLESLSDDEIVEIISAKIKELLAEIDSNA